MFFVIYIHKNIFMVIQFKYNTFIRLKHQHEQTLGYCCRGVDIIENDIMCLCGKSYKISFEKLTNESKNNIKYLINNYMMENIKFGDVVKCSNGNIGIFKSNTQNCGIEFAVIFDIIANELYYKNCTDVTVISLASEKERQILFDKITDNYTEENPTWSEYLTDSTYFEMLDWLSGKCCNTPDEYFDDFDQDNEKPGSLWDIIHEIVNYIFNSLTGEPEEGKDDLILDQLAETIYDIEFDNKRISNETDIIEMHEETCRNIHAKLSNIRYSSEVIKGTSSKEYTQTQEALMDMMWVCFAELHKRNVSINEMMEWKLNENNNTPNTRRYIF